VLDHGGQAAGGLKYAQGWFHAKATPKAPHRRAVQKPRRRRCETHSSKMAHRNFPYCSGSTENSETCAGTSESGETSFIRSDEKRSADALNDGDKLHEAASRFLQESITSRGYSELWRCTTVRVLNSTPCFFQPVDALQDLVETGGRRLYPPCTGCGFHGAVDGKPDKKAVIGQEGAPVIVEQDPVGLDSVLDFSYRGRVSVAVRQPFGKNRFPSAWVSPPCHAK